MTEIGGFLPDRFWKSTTR